MSHTPGPWTLRMGGISEEIVAISKRGKAWAIARTTASKCGRDQATANALLIAAAPELLDALKRFANLDADTNSYLVANCTKYCEQARAAIAKAEGK